MNNLNLEEKLKNGLSIEEIVKEFLSQTYEFDKKFFKKRKTPKGKEQEEIKDYLDYKFKDITIKTRYYDPRIQNIYVYAVFSKQQIEKLISFDEDYCSFNKEEKIIDGLSSHKSMTFNVYNIKYNENAYRTNVIFRILEQEDIEQGKHSIAESRYLFEKGMFAKDILIIEDDLDVAKFRLDHAGCIF